MRWILMLVVGLGSGCVNTFYEDGRTRVSRWGLCADSQANEVRVVCGERETVITVGMVAADGAKAAGTIVGTAVKAAR